jgi:hypothetical protein
MYYTALTQTSHNDARQDRALTHASQVMTFVEANLAGTVRYPDGVKLVVVAVQTLFGTHLAEEIRAWCSQWVSLRSCARAPVVCGVLVAVVRRAKEVAYHTHPPTHTCALCHHLRRRHPPPPPPPHHSRAGRCCGRLRLPPTATRRGGPTEAQSWTRGCLTPSCRQHSTSRFHQLLLQASIPRGDAWRT